MKVLTTAATHEGSSVFFLLIIIVYEGSLCVFFILTTMLSMKVPRVSLCFFVCVFFLKATATILRGSDFGFVFFTLTLLQP